MAVDRYAKIFLQSALSIIFICALFCLTAHASNTPTTILLDGSRSRYDLRDYVTVLPDEGYSIDQVSSPKYAKKFTKPDNNFYPGQRPQGYWLRFKIKTAPALLKEIWRIAVTPPQTKHMTLYFPERGKSGMRWGRWEAGYNNPERTSWLGEEFLARKIPLFSSATDYFLYYCAEDVNYNPLDLLDVNSFKIWGASKLIFYYLVAGFSLAIILYSLFVFISLRDASYFWYAVQCLTINVYYLFVNDSLIEFVDIPLNIYMVFNFLSLSLFALFSTIFVENFLSPIKSVVAKYRVYPILKSLAVICSVSSFYSAEIAGILTVNLFMFIPVVYIALGIIAYRKGFLPARLYLVAWGIFCIGFFLLGFGLFGAWININYLIIILQVANLIEMILFSLALAERIDFLRKDREVAEEFSSSKSTFLATMSHEIRTPLNAISGMTELILDSKLSQKQRSNLEVLKKSADHLQVLINDILDYSKIEAGKLSLAVHDFSLRDLRESVAEISKFAAEEKGLLFKVDVGNGVPDVVKGDPVRLKQILLNLLNNAVKFTDAGKISLRVRLDKNRKVEFFIEDTGVGISEEKQHHIFNKFYQADSSLNRRHGGTGLGLAITRQLVELMGGNISIESALNKGSSFIVTIPLEAGNPNKINAGPDVRSHVESATALKILVAEDNSNNIELLKAVFETTPYRVQFVRDGRAALFFLEKDDFDLCLIDLEMPEINGFEIVKTIRSGQVGESKTDIPIIVLTAHALEEIKVECLAAGVNGFLVKPFHIAEMLRTVEAAASESSCAFTLQSEGV